MTKPTAIAVGFVIISLGGDPLSHARGVVPWALRGLTAVFGMGTGDPSRQSHPKTQGSVAWRSPAFAVVAEHPENRTVMIAASKHMGVGTRLSSSPRPISTGPLHGLPRFHFRPIYLVVCQGPY